MLLLWTCRTRRYIQARPPDLEPPDGCMALQTSLEMHPAFMEGNVKRGPGHRIIECISCNTPTEPRKGYDWCPRCFTAMWCACEECEILKVLANLW